MSSHRRLWLSSDQYWETKTNYDGKARNEIVLPYVIDVQQMGNRERKEKHAKSIEKAMVEIQHDFQKIGVNIDFKRERSWEDAPLYNSTTRYVRIIPVTSCACTVDRQLKASHYKAKIDVQKTPLFKKFFESDGICKEVMKECQDRHAFDPITNENWIDFKTCVEDDCLSKKENWKFFPEQTKLKPLGGDKVLNYKKIFLTDGDKTLDNFKDKPTYKSRCVNTLFTNMFYDKDDSRKIQTSSLTGMPLNCLPDSVFGLSHRGRVSKETYEMLYENRLGQPIYLNKKHMKDYTLILKRRILQVLGLSWNHQNVKRDESILNTDKVFENAKFDTDVKDEESIDFGNTDDYKTIHRIDTESILFHPEILFSEQSINADVRGKVEYGTFTKNYLI